MPWLTSFFLVMVSSSTPTLRKLWASTGVQSPAGTGTPNLRSSVGHHRSTSVAAAIVHCRLYARLCATPRGRIWVVIQPKHEKAPGGLGRELFVAYGGAVVWHSGRGLKSDQPSWGVRNPAAPPKSSLVTV